jgi:hypothetical protein
MAKSDQKQKVINQFKELQKRLSTSPKIASEIDAIIDKIVDLTNRHVPELSNIIDSLKAMEKEKSYMPDMIALKHKLEKANLYLNQIITYIEQNELSVSEKLPVQSNFLSGMTSDQLITLIIFTIGVVFAVGWFASDIGHKIDEQEFKRTIDRQQDTITLLKKDLSRIAPADLPADKKANPQKTIDKKQNDEKHNNNSNLKQNNE